MEQNLETYLSLSLIVTDAGSYIWSYWCNSDYQWEDVIHLGWMLLKVVSFKYRTFMLVLQRPAPLAPVGFTYILPDAM